MKRYLIEKTPQLRLDGGMGFYLKTYNETEQYSHTYIQGIIGEAMHVKLTPRGVYLVFPDREGEDEVCGIPTEPVISSNRMENINEIVARWGQAAEEARPRNPIGTFQTTAQADAEGNIRITIPRAPSVAGAYFTHAEAIYQNRAIDGFDIHHNLHLHLEDQRGVEHYRTVAGSSIAMGYMRMHELVGTAALERYYQGYLERAVPASPEYQYIREFSEEVFEHAQYLLRVRLRDHEYYGHNPVGRMSVGIGYHIDQGRLRLCTTLVVRTINVPVHDQVTAW